MGSVRKLSFLLRAVCIRKIPFHLCGMSSEMVAEAGILSSVYHKASSSCGLKLIFPSLGLFFPSLHALLFTVHAVSKIDASKRDSTFKYILLASPFF